MIQLRCAISRTWWCRKPKGQINRLLWLKNLDIPINDYKTRTHLSKKMSHYWDKAVSWTSYLYSGNPNTWKDRLYNETGTWAPSQYPKRRLSVRSRKVSKPRDWYLKLSYRFEIWQAHRQHCCRSSCQISERSDNSKYKSRGFDTLRDLTERRLFGYWDGAQIAWPHNYLLVYPWVILVNIALTNNGQRRYFHHIYQTLKFILNWFLCNDAYFTLEKWNKINILWTSRKWNRRRTLAVIMASRNFRRLSKLGPRWPFIIPYVTKATPT